MSLGSKDINIEIKKFSTTEIMNGVATIQNSPVMILLVKYAAKIYAK